jgi:CheY-like chemotaxis protein
MSNVLIIDDDPIIIELCRLMLKRYGFQALVASTGSEGEALALQHHPCLVLLDIRMPGQDGAETCRRLRARGYGGMIALMSTYQELAGLEQVKDCGANSYLAKPILSNALKILLDYAADQAAETR